MKIEKMNRRGFLKTSAMGFGTLVVVSWLPQAEGVNGRLRTTISRNHGHRFTAKLSEVIANVPHTYNIRGLSFHAHEVTLSQEMIDTLVARKVIDVESSRDSGHSHWLRFEII